LFSLSFLFFFGDDYQKETRKNGDPPGSVTQKVNIPHRTDSGDFFFFFFSSSNGNIFSKQKKGNLLSAHSSQKATKKQNKSPFIQVKGELAAHTQTREREKVPLSSLISVVGSGASAKGSVPFFKCSHPLFYYSTTTKTSSFSFHFFTIYYITLRENVQHEECCCWTASDDQGQGRCHRNIQRNNLLFEHTDEIYQLAVAAPQYIHIHVLYSRVATKLQF